MAQNRILDFNHLPRSARERFVACLQGRSAPAPIFVMRSGGAVVGWVLLGLVALGVLAWIPAASFGSMYSCRQSPLALLGMAIALFLVGLSAFGVLRRMRLSGSLPFPTGKYVFPMDIVIAESKDLELIPFANVVSLQPVHHYRNGFYTHTAFHISTVGGRRFTFSARSKPFAEAMLGNLRRSQMLLDQAIAARDVDQIAALDPFFDVRMQDWQNVSAGNEDGVLMARQVPSWLKMGWAAGLGLAVLAAPLWLARNALSDEIAFSKAKRSDNTYSYEDYLWKGTRHADEVRQNLLPHAELRDAKEKQSVAAIKDFLVKYPHSSVDAEAQQALKDAIHDDFVTAKNAGTVSALRAFIKDYPKADDVGAAKTAIHRLFEETLADFRPKANVADKNVLPFVQSLLAYEEMHDSSSVAVRFRRHNSVTLAAADKILAADDPGDTGPMGFAAVSQHFDPQDGEKRERAMVGALQSAFGEVFPADVLPLELGDVLPDDPKEKLDLTKPTILIDYVVGWSGETYVNRKESRRFVGIKIAFDVKMVQPDDEQALTFQMSVLPPDHFHVSYDTFTDPSFGALVDNPDAGPSDSLVYEIMAARAFDQLSTKLELVFFHDAPVHRRKPKADPDPKLLRGLGGAGAPDGLNGLGSNPWDDPTDNP